jgi:hypothetical protein
LKNDDAKLKGLHWIISIRLASYRIRLSPISAIFVKKNQREECVMVNSLDMALEEIEVLRKRMHDLYLLKRSLKNQNLIRMSKKLDQKLNIFHKLIRFK